MNKQDEIKRGFWLRHARAVALLGLLLAAIGCTPNAVFILHYLVEGMPVLLIVACLLLFAVGLAAVAISTYIWACAADATLVDCTAAVLSSAVVLILLLRAGNLSASLYYAGMQVDKLDAFLSLPELWGVGLPALAVSMLPHLVARTSSRIRKLSVALFVLIVFATYVALAFMGFYTVRVSDVFIQL